MFGFRQVWCADTEYGVKPDGSFGPDVRCLVAKELHGTAPPIRLWADQLRQLGAPPFDVTDSLFVAFNATAELQVFIELGWPMPRHVLDLWLEYRAVTNGKRAKQERTRLLDALACYRIDAITAAEKQELQDLALRGGPYNEQERQDLMEYCESDVDALIALLRSEMAAELQAFHPEEMLFRGRFMVAQTRSDRVGTPTDVPMLSAIQENRETIRRTVIDEYEKTYGWDVFENGELRLAKAADWLKNCAAQGSVIQAGNIERVPSGCSITKWTLPPWCNRRTTTTRSPARGCGGYWIRTSKGCSWAVCRRLERVQ
jgi:DNA polymerase I